MQKHQYLNMKIIQNKKLIESSQLCAISVSLRYTSIYLFIYLCTQTRISTASIYFGLVVYTHIN